MGWHEHDHRLFRGTERFFRPGYRAHLVAEWIPALDGVQEKLQRGAKVADVGCGHGASTIIMAEAFPNSQFFGFDYHDASIERAREAAKDAGVAERITFQVAEQLSRVVDEEVKYQAATFSSVVVVSSSVTLMPSLNFAPSSTSVTSSWPLNRRQRSWAASKSL